MQFTKMHGIGNDYVYVDAFANKIADPAKLATVIADRHFGVGGDGLILVAPPTPAAQAHGAVVRMRMFNADGSESEMCGNGVRCVAKYAWDHKLARVNPMLVETGRGVLSIALDVQGDQVASATVNMGPPILDLAQVPVAVAQVQATSAAQQFSFTVPGAGTFTGVFVSMGNPHVTIYVPDVAAVPLEVWGPRIETFAAFPRRINVHFVQLHSRTELTMRTWERGSGITLACGTGASAVAVAGVLTGQNDRKVLIHLPGGDLRLEWRESDNNVYMTGPATEVFSGTWPNA